MKSRRNRISTSSAYLDRIVRCKPNVKARIGKVVYIRPEYHTMINKIIMIIGNDDNTIFGYLDNVLTEHFNNHKQEIDQLYRSNTTKLL